MNSEKLQNLILNAIEKKKISQRELAKLTGISRSTLNDILNGKIKKIKLDDLYQISIPLELNLENLLKACGFNSVIKSLNTDRYAGMSDRQLKEKLDEYQQSELNLLDWDAQKRKNVRKARQQLFTTIEYLKIMQEKKDSLYTIEQAIKDIQFAFEQLEMAEHKYDYSKLPKSK